MKRLAIKRLTASDLTLFEHHFRNRSAGNQKSINLNAAVFADVLYPVLQSDASSRIPLDLSIYGPSEAGLHNVQRKIIKGGSYKNWRLNGEMISDPDGESGRYDMLQPGDLAVMEFFGDAEPRSATMVLVASSGPDASLHTTLDALFPAGKSMAAMSVTDLQRAVSESTVSGEHPIQRLLADTLLDDLAMGSTSDTQPTVAPSRLPIASREQLQRTREVMDEIGRTGEDYVDVYLNKAKERGELNGYEWTADINAISPFDFWIDPVEGERRVIDAKSTSGPFGNPLYISLNELRQMAYGDEPYDLYRVYEVGDDGAKMRRALDLRAFAASILDVLNSLPAGVRSNGVSVSPNMISFQTDEIPLDPRFTDDG